MSLDAKCVAHCADALTRALSLTCSLITLAPSNSASSQGNGRAVISRDRLNDVGPRSRASRARNPISKWLSRICVTTLPPTSAGAVATHRSTEADPKERSLHHRASKCADGGSSHGDPVALDNPDPKTAWKFLEERDAGGAALPVPRPASERVRFCRRRGRTTPGAARGSEVRRNSTRF